MSSGSVRFPFGQNYNVLKSLVSNFEILKNIGYFTKFLDRFCRSIVEVRKTGVGWKKQHIKCDIMLFVKKNRSNYFVIFLGWKFF